MMKKNPYASQNAVIEKVVQETPGIKTFQVRPDKAFSFRCGQFAELLVPGVGEAPFAPSSPAYRPELLEFTIQNVGYMTSRLHAMDAGDRVGLRGPYGNGFPLDAFKGRDILLLIGGVGFPPARALLYSLLQDRASYPRIVMCYGARSPRDIVYQYQLDDLGKEIEFHITVDRPDEGWTGKTGVVTTLLDKVSLNLGKTAAVVIGPPIMMKFGTLKLLKVGFPPESIYLSMERKMYCGVGQCRHCMIDHLFICKDGPVFQFSQLQHFSDIWE
jgi:NAD(P)H-flavin reductase